MRLFENLNIDFLSKRKTFYVVSAVLFLLGLLSILFRGVQFGIDFKGGSEIAVQFEKPIELQNIRDYLGNIGLGQVEVKTFGGDNAILVRTELQELPSNVLPVLLEKINRNIDQILPNVPRTISDSSVNSFTFSFENPDTANILIEALFERGFQTTKVIEEPENVQMTVRAGISDWVKENLKEKLPDNNFELLKEEKVGPKIGNELKRDALIAVSLSLLVILIYLGFRFKFIFAVGAVLALFHDVLITFGLYSLLYDVIPGLNLEISITVVAAFLTLVGYSINDTVIVFDRIRENLKIHKTLPLEETINKAINKTMSRTIITGLTTLLTVFILLIFGGEVLRAFAFTLFFGIIIGTYSSIFIASAFVLDYSLSKKSKIQF